MGRPIKKSFFSGGDDVAVVAGQSVTSVTVVTTGSNYSTATVVTFSQPDLPSGTLATGHATFSSGHIVSIVMDSNGSGYTADPGIALTNVGTGSGATFSVVLASTLVNTNKIACNAYLPANSSVAMASTILKQEASHRYLVENSDGIGQCKLVGTSTLVAGQMNITATDSAGGSYYVTKLTARKAQLTQNTGIQFVTGSYAGWSTGTAVANVSVKVSVN
jgi:hypothetical protein